MFLMFSVAPSLDPSKAAICEGTNSDHWAHTSRMLLLDEALASFSCQWKLWVGQDADMSLRRASNDLSSKTTL